MWSDIAFDNREALIAFRDSHYGLTLAVFIAAYVAIVAFSLPGATVPFGMVQLSPDTRLSGWDGCSGYHYSDDVVYGFSHTHLSGTGVADYCDVLRTHNPGDTLDIHGGGEDLQQQDGRDIRDMQVLQDQD